MNRRKPQSGNGFICWSFILILMAGLGLLYYQNNQLSQNCRGLIKKLHQEQVVVFFIENKVTDFKLKPVICTVKANEDRHLQALQILFGPPIKRPPLKLIELFPKGIKILSFTVKNGLATVDLNEEVRHLNVGSGLETLAVASIVNTLTKFPDIYRVKILIEGKEVESLAGHVDLTNNLNYNDQVVDPIPAE